MNDALTRRIAVEAARLVVETGFEYAAAKRKAARALGQRRGAMPTNEQVEDEVRSHIELFCADSQPGELAALRAVAAAWMERLREFRPHLTGAVWRGTATRQSAVHVDLYCDDPKAAEIALLNLGVAHDVDTLESDHGQGVDVLTVSSPCPALGAPVTVHLFVRDLDEQRGALRPDARGHSWRGDLTALRRLMGGAAG